MAGLESFYSHNPPPIRDRLSSEEERLRDLPTRMAGWESFFSHNPPPIRDHSQLSFEEERLRDHPTRMAGWKSFFSHNPPPIRDHCQLSFQEERLRDHPTRMAGWESFVWHNPSPIRDHCQLSFQEERLREIRTNNLDDSPAKLSKLPRSFCSSFQPKNQTNLDRVVIYLTPSVPSLDFSKAKVRDWRDYESDLNHYCLGDLWESFREWTAHGVGVPLLFKGKGSITQEFIPYLSGIQLYVDSRKFSSTFRKECSDEAETFRFPGMLLFEYLEQDLSLERKNLTDKVSDLVSVFPALKMYRSCDLLPTSWISVAWKPIDLSPIDASLLTFHSLSTHSSRNNQLRVHCASTGDASSKVSLPIFGLASILIPNGQAERQQHTSLWQAADDWLRHLKVDLRDYKLFCSNYSAWLKLSQRSPNEHIEVGSLSRPGCVCSVKKRNDMSVLDMFD